MNKKRFPNICTRRTVSVYILLPLSFVVCLLSLALVGVSQASVTKSFYSTRTPYIRRTPTPTPRTARFSLVRSTKRNPGDVLEEIFYASIGGGGDSCKRDYSRPFVDQIIPSANIELLRPVKLITCGWKNNEQVEITIQYPNGRVVRHYDKAGEDLSPNKYTVHYEFMPEWQDPTGTYKFTFRAPSGWASKSVRITMPSSPRVIWFGDGRLLLYKFAPRETVRLFVYNKPTSVEGLALSGWQSYKVDTQGNLWINLERNPKYTVIVLGEKSGESRRWGLYAKNPISLSVKKLKPGESYILRSSCPGAPPQRLRIGIRAAICTKNDRVIIRREPNRNAREITRLFPGTDLSVVAGPICANNWSWWKINSSGIIGWVAEGGDRIDPYFVCPVMDASDFRQGPDFK